jgi:hypothetical protein
MNAETIEKTCLEYCGRKDNDVSNSVSDEPTKMNSIVQMKQELDAHLSALF